MERQLLYQNEMEKLMRNMKRLTIEFTKNSSEERKLNIVIEFYDSKWFSMQREVLYFTVNQIQLKVF